MNHFVELNFWSRKAYFFLRPIVYQILNLVQLLL